MSDDAVVAVCILIAMIAAAVVSVRTVLVGRASRQWPTVKGRVVSLEVVGIQRGNLGTGTYRPTIKYRYTVSGRNYLGSRIRVSNFLTMGMEKTSQLEAREVLDGYYPGSEVDVYFDPRRPARSLLQPGPLRMHYFAAWGLVIATPVIAAAFWAAFFLRG